MTGTSARHPQVSIYRLRDAVEPQVVLIRHNKWQLLIERMRHVRIVLRILNGNMIFSNIYLRYMKRIDPFGAIHVTHLLLIREHYQNTSEQSIDVNVLMRVNIVVKGSRKGVMLISTSNGQTSVGLLNLTVEVEVPRSGRHQYLNLHRDNHHNSDGTILRTRFRLLYVWITSYGWQQAFEEDVQR